MVDQDSAPERVGGLKPFFAPRVVAVIGVSRDILASGFTGQVVAIHPTVSDRLLRGFRGNAPDDEGAFRDAILRVSALVGICPEIQELDINPLSVLPGGVSALDVRVRVAANAH